MGNCNKESILNRINEFRDYSAISKSTLAATIGVEQTTLNNQLIGKRGLSLDTVIALLKTFEDLSSEWLLRDRGDMFLTKYDGSFEADNLKMAQRIDKLIGTIETMQESIDLKNKSIDLYKEELKAKDETIKSLMERINLLETQLTNKKI